MWSCRKEVKKQDFVIHESCLHFKNIYYFFPLKKFTSPVCALNLFIKYKKLISPDYYKNHKS